MSYKILLAIDQFEDGCAAVDVTVGIASVTQAKVHVVHVREVPRSLRVPPLETEQEAQTVVDGAVAILRAAEIEAEGTAISDRETRVARRIVEGAASNHCDAIVLDSLRLRGIQSIMGHGTRERVLRLSPLPVVVTPPSLSVDWGDLASIGRHG